MSNVTKQKYSFWKDVLVRLRRKSRTINGFPLEQQATIAEVYALYATVIADVLSLDPILDKRRMLRIIAALDRLELDNLIKVTDVLRDLVVTWPHSEGAFKQHIHDAQLCKVERDFVSEFKSLVLSQDIGDLTALNTIACFPTRLNVPRPDLEAELVEDYVQRDLGLPTELPSWVWEVREIINEWFRDFEFKPLVPHHGPGSVSQIPGRAISPKYDELYLDQQLVDFLSKTTPGWWYYYDSAALSHYSKSFRLSELVFVPKSVKTLRAINKEPAGLMFWQQAVKDQLYSYMHDHPYISKIIDLEDASVNALMALSGSKDGSFATIDLSAASDSVSWFLVTVLFGQTKLYDAFKALRAPCVLLPTGSIHAQRKFAPMGNALCFPIECLVFSAIVERRVRMATRARRHSLYQVYGDDIIVHDYFSRAVMRDLEELGFRVNVSKSFTGKDTRFRESCGVEGYLGNDITPIRVSRRFKSTQDISVSKKVAYDVSRAVDALKPLYNTCYKYWYKNTCDLIRLIVRPEYVFYTLPEYSGWHSWYPTNYHLVYDEISSADLQTSCYHGFDWVLQADGPEEVRLRHWFVEATRLPDRTEALHTKVGSVSSIQSSSTTWMI